MKIRSLSRRAGMGLYAAARSVNTNCSGFEERLTADWAFLTCRSCWLAIQIDAVVSPSNASPKDASDQILAGAAAARSANSDVNMTTAVMGHAPAGKQHNEEATSLFTSV